MAKQDSKKAKKEVYSLDPVQQVELSDKQRKKQNKKAAKKAAKKTGEVAMKPFTKDEKDLFAARIKNEKSNIWRIGNRDPKTIIDFVEANVADEKNAAVRFARRDAKAWAQRELQPVVVPY